MGGGRIACPSEARIPDRHRLLEFRAQSDVVLYMISTRLDSELMREILGGISLWLNTYRINSVVIRCSMGSCIWIV